MSTEKKSHGPNYFVGAVIFISAVTAGLYFAKKKKLWFFKDTPAIEAAKKSAQRAAEIKAKFDSINKELDAIAYSDSDWLKPDEKKVKELYPRYKVLANDLDSQIKLWEKWLPEYPETKSALDSAKGLQERLRKMNDSFVAQAKAANIALS